MSLAAISGRVSSINIGSSIGRMANTALVGESNFLRNESTGGVAGAVSSVVSLGSALTDIASAAGIRSNMYRIGMGGKEAEKSDSWYGQIWNNIKATAQTAISYWTDKDGNQQSVIIDGFDNFKGDIKVALAEQPVMYQPSISDNRVRNPNRLTMRIYVDLVHSDDVFQDLLQQVKDGIGGLVGQIMGVATGDTMNRAQKALSGLQYIQENGTPFKVYTPHKVYENMVIESISPVNDLRMNEILAADITFKEIIFCKSLSAGYAIPARFAPSKIVSAASKAWGWVSSKF